MTNTGSRLATPVVVLPTFSDSLHLLCKAQMLGLQLTPAYTTLPLGL